MEKDEVLKRLEALADQDAVEGMARFGITPGRAYGVSIPDLRRLAKEIGLSHELAGDLWAIDARETRILATMVDDPRLVTETQMDRWVEDFDYWEVCDQCCMNLFQNADKACEKCVEWSARDEEFVKRAGFVLMARLAVSDKGAKDETFERFLPIIRREASDERNFVKKAVNWALRQIGKRNATLNQKALGAAEEIRVSESRSARWVASDAIRELTSEAVRQRLTRNRR